MTPAPPALTHGASLARSTTGGCQGIRRHGKRASESGSEEQGPTTPGSVRMVFNPAFRASLPDACATPAAQFCPGMTRGEGRVFACLYAPSDRVTKACSDAAQAALEQAK